MEEGEKMKFLKRRARFLAGMCLLQFPIALLLPDVWWISATTHFLPQQILLLLASILIWKFPAWRALGVVLGIALAAVILISPFLPEIVSDIESAEAGNVIQPDVQLISFNVLTSNSRKKDVSEWISSSLSKESPNVVFLMETDDAWIESLRDLERALPYKYLNPRPDNFGLAVYSSVPIEHAGVEVFEDVCGVPQFIGDLRLPAKTLRLFGSHTLPPMALGNIEYRDACIDVIENEAMKSPMPTVVAGDLNCSPWSRCFPRRLTDSFPLFFRKHTWNVLGGIVSTSLDHVLHTPGVRTKAHVGPDLGSDHKPIVTQIWVD